MAVWGGGRGWLLHLSFRILDWIGLDLLVCLCDDISKGYHGMTRDYMVGTPPPTLCLPFISLHFMRTASFPFS